MKTLISILLLFCSFVSYSQTSFSDTLVNIKAFTREEIILNKDNTFKYSFCGCDLCQFGTGIYTSENNLLTLNFIDNDTLTSDIKIIENECEKDKLINIDFIIVDKENHKLSDVTLVNNKNEIIAKSNSDGFISLKNINKNDKLRIKFKHSIYNSFYLDLIADYCKLIKVRMKFDSVDESIIYGVKKKYEMNKDNPNKNKVVKSLNTKLTLTPIIEKEED